MRESSWWRGEAPKEYTEGFHDGGQLEFVDAPPEGGKLVDLAGIASSFAPVYAPEEIMEIANKLYQKAKGLSGAGWSWKVGGGVE